MREIGGMKGGRREGERKMQAHYFKGEWQVTYFATLVDNVSCKSKFMGISIIVFKNWYVCKFVAMRLCLYVWRK